MSWILLKLKKKPLLCSVSLSFASDVYSLISYRVLEQLYQTRKTAFYHILKHQEESRVKKPHFATCVWEVWRTSVGGLFSIFCLIIRKEPMKAADRLACERSLLIPCFNHDEVFSKWSFSHDNNSYHCGSISGSSLSHEICYIGITRLVE